ncbi:AfsR/SARP family transcriptional regulator [Sphaerisporangium fuscum]|uniref:AfsR/SARP family transcriptional regulator n=1 Tax=Sphaerisporangium fuscum TaxID=2835868 RepID=UPI001BDD2FE5|nr:BTAD domain-containing putative transcriptional regulator [Sphaerisporangium fuscum]
MIARPKHRQVLAALLSAAGQVVAADQLIGYLWDHTPPPSARGNLKTYVWSLRRLLAPGDPASAPIETVADGYRISVPPGELDCLTFSELAGQGRAALKAGDVRRAEVSFQRALALWRGPAFQDIPLTLRLGEIAAQLEEERAGAFEDWVETRLALGMHAEVIARSRRWLREHPLRERSWGQLMLALARDGRRAEALETFHELRNRLVDELGVEPGFPIRELHRRILDGDAELFTLTPVTPPPSPQDDAAPAARPATGPAEPAAVPRQLPSEVPGFVGRRTEVARLVSWLNPPGDALPVPVVGICGPPGAGKSALALRVAHLAAGRFPDGQVYVNLRGATPGVRRLPTGELLGRILRTFGVPGADVPVDADEAASVLRTLLHGRRVLLLLDDAASVAQVGPLLPMTPGSTVLVTSRESFAAAAPGAHVNLGPMLHSESVAMLTRRFESVGIEFSEEAVHRLAVLCDRLPLALHVAGARLESRANWSADTLIERLEDEGRRLDELRTGEIGVRSSIAVSYAGLEESGQEIDREAARAFRLIGALNVPELGLGAVAALLDAPARVAEETVERLFDVRLVDCPAPDRYTMHDLVRLFARERAAGGGPEEGRDVALRRVLGHYLATASLAVGLLEPHRVHVTAPAVPQAPLPLRDRAEAGRWLERERPNLLTLVGQAWDRDAATARLAVALALTMRWYLAAHGYRHDMLRLGQMSLEVARRLGDRASESQALGLLSMAHRLLNDQAAELACLRRELELCRELGDLFGEQRALGNLASALLLMEHSKEALDLAERQLEISRRIGSGVGERYALIMAGEAHVQLGGHDEAAAMLLQALGQAQDVGDALHEGMARRRLGEAYLLRGDIPAARSQLTASLASFGPQGPERSEAMVGLARSSRLLGRLEEAAAYAEEALEIARESGDRHDEQRALEERDEIGRRLGRTPCAG